MLKKGGKKRGGSIIVCDTCGFDDSNGHEVDIANGVGLMRAIYNCKEARPVIVISKKA